MINKKGFSFLELMVTIAIAGIMTAAMMASMNVQREKKSVETSAREVAAAIREAQTYALTGKDLQGRTASCVFTFSWAAGSAYGISGCKNQSYSLKNNVNFANANSLSFSVPNAYITPAGFPKDINLSKGGSNYHVCVFSSGIVSESLNACDISASCGDGTCNGTDTCSNCPSECGACAPFCNDGVCNGTDTCSNCPEDCSTCSPSCGDGVCNGTDTCSNCPGDCACAPVCNDGTCNGTDTCSNCPGDCGACVFLCSGLQANAVACAGTGNGLTQDRNYSLVNPCAASQTDKCEATCSSGYNLSGGVCVAVPVQANPTNLVLSHITRSKSFSVSWTAGKVNGGAGGCKLQFFQSGSTWTDITSAVSVNCDANSSAAAYNLNADGWKSNWGGTQIRLVRKSDSAAMGTFPTALSCSSIAGSASSTPTIDENCNGQWDDHVTGSCAQGGTEYMAESYTDPNCQNSVGGSSSGCVATGSQSCDSSCVPYYSIYTKCYASGCCQRYNYTYY